MKTILVTPHHVLRRQVEICIRDIYEREYGATVTDFPNTLIATVDDIETPICAAGLRFAAGGFFSESYLDEPIEKTLSEWTGRPVERERIFEVTTLASRSASASLPFVRQIVDFGESSGFDWAFFTATERLRALLRSIGLPFMVVADAVPSRIVNSARWGNYYNCAPRVCAVDSCRLAPSRAAPEPGRAHA